MKARRDTPKAVMLVLASMAIAPVVDVTAKYLGQEGIPVLQLVWGRLFFGALCSLPFAMMSSGYSAFQPINVRLNVLRTSCLLAGTGFFFLALKYLPVADTLAVYFVQPLFITAFSPMVLKEYVSPRRWTMVCLGFVGVLIIIRPGLQALNLGHFFALCAGMSSAFYYLVTHFLTGKARPIVTTFQTGAIGALAMCVAAPRYWVSPNGTQWLMLVGLGAIAILAHYLITKAYDHGDASLLSPLNYSEMIMSVLLGWVVFEELPDIYTFIGVFILIGCAIYISQYESRNIVQEGAEAQMQP